MEKTISFNRLIKLWIFPVTVLGLIAGLYVPFISLGLLAVQIGWMIFADDEDISALMLFTLPFASIFKYSTDTITLFTVVEVAVVAIMMFRTKKCSSYLLIGTIIFALYTLLTPNRDYISTVKLVLIIFLFYYLIPASRKDVVYISFSFVIGLLLSSGLACMRDYFPIISLYVEPVEDYTVIGMIDRFAGLHPDPNYYAANIILALFLLLALYHNKYIKNLFWILIVPLTVFGFMTVSKSFLFIYVVFLFTLVLTQVNKRKFLWLALLVVAVCIGWWFIQNSNLTYFVNLRARFAYDDLNEFTTGRLGVSGTYLNYVLTNWTTLLFGDGIGAELLFAEGKFVASHNFYIDLIYYFGIIGTLLFAINLGIVISKYRRPLKRNLLTYMPIIGLAIMYTSLSTLLFIDFPFHLLLVFIVFDMEVKDEKIHRLSAV